MIWVIGKMSWLTQVRLHTEQINAPVLRPHDEFQTIERTTNVEVAHIQQGPFSVLEFLSTNLQAYRGLVALRRRPEFYE